VKKKLLFLHDVLSPSLSLMLLLFEIRTCKQTRNGVPRVVVAKTRRTMKMLPSSVW
jgi:hypothetical protein